ncbi:hypothetical protein BH24GEM1_BH24GEM1_22260 [soil metagenome]
MVESGGNIEIVDVEMDVAHPGAPGSSAPRLSPAGSDEVVQVEEVGRHREGAALCAPRGPRPVGIDLDAQAVGIGEVQRLAHEVVRRSGVFPDGAEVRHEAAERRPAREKQGEVVESEAPASRHRSRAPALDKLDERHLVARRRKGGECRIPMEHLQAKHALVVPD